MLIVGSKSFHLNFPNQNRNINDIDIIASVYDADKLIDNLRPQSIIKTEHIYTLKNIVKNDTFDKNNVEILISDKSKSLNEYLQYDGYDGKIKCCSPEVLFSLKKSHIHFPIKFYKHIKDYCFLFNFFNGYDKLSDITKCNFEETEKRIGRLITPSLNKSVSNFFDQSNGYVKSYFIHDDIHKSVSHYKYPLYLKMQKDTSIAKCDKSLWLNFSFEDKCKCVLEEAYVIALERKILPMLFGRGKYYSSTQAIDWALMRICTTLCSGWFREFATDNYLIIKDLIDNSYVERFLNKVHVGEINRCISKNRN